MNHPAEEEIDILIEDILRFKNATEDRKKDQV